MDRSIFSNRAGFDHGIARHNAEAYVGEVNGIEHSFGILTQAEKGSRIQQYFDAATGTGLNRRARSHLLLSPNVCGTFNGIHQSRFCGDNELHYDEGSCKHGVSQYCTMRFDLRTTGLISLLSATFVAFATFAQTLKVDVNLVLVNATVADLKGRLVAGLETQHFRIWEDDVEQTVESFSVEDLPISVGLIFDATGSMADKLSSARDAATAFLKTSNPRDEYFLIEFSDPPKLVQDFTTDIPRLQRRIFSSSARGLTPLYDAVHMGLDKIEGARNTKKALLIISDGEDNHSHYTFSDIREFARHHDAQIYAIGLIDSAQGQRTIRDLVETSGGRAFFPNSADQLQDICTRIAIELKNQYLLGYRSTNEVKDGKWRQIHVEVNPPRGLPPLTVRARTGYYAPVSQKG